MNATTHPFAPEEIMAFLDGELVPSHMQAVSAHIETCHDCSEVLVSFRNASLRMSDWQVSDIPASLNSAPTLERNERTKTGTLSGLFASLRSKNVIVWTAVITTGFAILMAIAVPNLLRSKMAARESSVANSDLDRAVSMDQEEKINALDGHKSLAENKAYAAKLQGKDSNGLFQSANSQARYSFSLENDLKKDDQDRSLSAPMIARTVSLAVVTKDFETSRKSLDTILARHNGYSAQLTVTTPQGAARSLQASLRIPAPQLTSAVVELKSLGRVETESQNGEEVTQQHADLVARLKNSRETEQRLQAILAQRTGKISDVLSVEQEIARVRGEIEQMEAEQKNLEHRVDFATIDLTLSEEYKAQLGAPAPSVSTLLHNALVNGLRTAADSVLSLVLFLSESGPVLLLWLAILALPARQLWRRYRRAIAI